MYYLLAVSLAAFSYVCLAHVCMSKCVHVKKLWSLSYSVNLLYMECSCCEPDFNILANLCFLSLQIL